MTPADRYARTRLNRELEQRLSLSGADDERERLAEAYQHAAMRRRTRAEAVRLTAALDRQYALDGDKRVSKASNRTRLVVTPETCRDPT